MCFGFACATELNQLISRRAEEQLIVLMFML
jgi:hypothetical protein